MYGDTPGIESAGSLTSDVVTFKHFEMLASPQSWQSPLAVIAHIDLDAFYAQCQSVQNNIDPSEPLCCRQWQAVIAVNYPARKFGIKRGMTVDECRKLCPSVHLPHVATFKKGEAAWDLHRDPEPGAYKVSLDLFRRESRKIFRILKNTFRKVEKAGIDEGFIDLGFEVRKAALSKHPELSDDSLKSSDELPPVPIGFETWHDALLSLGADIVRDCRQAIYKELKYTCSAGIGSNKLIGKLGSACNKPFNQTLVLESEKLSFLDGYKLKDIWGWGGKTGKHVLTALDIEDDDPDQIRKIRDKSNRELAAKLGADMALKLHQVVLGTSRSDVSSRTTIKSMASVKQFRHPSDIKDKIDAIAWLHVFIADLYGRVKDLEADENRQLRPRTIGVKYTDTKGDHQSRQLSVAAAADLESQLLSVGQQLLEDNVPLPCNLLSLEISNFTELPKEKISFEPIPQSEIEKDLFVSDNEDFWTCKECRKTVMLEKKQEHEDWHMAKSLQFSDDPVVSSSRSAAKKTESTPKKRKTVNGASPSTSRTVKKDRSQMGIKDFFGPRD